MKASHLVAVFASFATLALAPHAAAQSAASRMYDFRIVRPPINASTDEAIAVGIQDRRPYVLSGEKRESFVGLSRSKYGLPWHAHTNSKAPLSTDLADALVEAFASRRVKAVRVRIAPADSREQVVAALAAQGTPKVLLITIEEWHTDMRSTTRLDFAFRAELLTPDGKELVRHSISGAEDFDSRIIVAQTAANKLGELLRSSISAALQAPPKQIEGK